ncbi:hypothetical protein HK101_002311 [Irineochytrium annulatum]|nr:hypothetical protein HK101_002311 [Irineochytrium annulatum]
MTSSGIAIPQGDYCAGLFDGDKVLIGAQVISCYTSFPITRAAVEAHSLDMIAYLALYTPLYGIKGLWSGKVDLLKAIYDLKDANPTYTNEFDMHAEISRIFYLAGDINLVYVPYCFNQFDLYQPWMFNLRNTSSGQQEVVIADYVRVEKYDVDGFFSSIADVKKLVGATVTQINNQPAAAFIQSTFAALFNYSPNADLNFQNAFENNVLENGTYTEFISFLSATGNPFAGVYQQNVTYTLTDTAGTTHNLAVPWASVYFGPSGVKDGADYYKKVCLPNAASTGAVRTGRREAVARRGILGDGNYVISDQRQAPLARRNLASGPNPLYSDDSNKFYKLDGANGLWLAGFGHRGETTDVNLFIAMSEGLNMLRATGVTNLVIDVGEAGPASSCNAFTALTFLLAGSNETVYDLRLTEDTSPVYRKALTNNITTPNTFSLSSFTPIAGATTVLDPTPELSRGGKAVHYSSPFTSNCASHASAILAKMSALANPWPASNIYILSNGRCYAGCGEFVRALVSQFGVKTIVTSGVARASFPPTLGEYGLSLVDCDAAHRDAVAIMGSTSSFPPELKYRVQCGIPQFESYAPGTKPDDVSGVGSYEMAPLSADWFVPVVDATDRVSVWEGVVSAVGPLRDSAAAAAAADASAAGGALKGVAVLGIVIGVVAVGTIVAALCLFVWRRPPKFLFRIFRRRTAATTDRPWFNTQRVPRREGAVGESLVDNGSFLVSAMPERTSTPRGVFGTRKGRGDKGNYVELQGLGGREE